MAKPGNGGGKGGGGSGGGGNTATVLIKGGNGPDILSLPPDRTILNTYFDGGKGSDTLDLSAHTDGVTVTLNNRPGSESIVSTDDFVGTTWSFTTYNDLSDRLNGSIKNIENIIGTQGNDRLLVNDPGRNRVDGGTGNDSITVVGGGGDTLIGGTGEDWLVGYGAGNILVGGTWNGGTPTGDGERDVFVLSQGTILDFEIGTDRVMIETADYAIMNAALAAVWTAATWVDSDGVTRSGAQLQVTPGYVIRLANVDPADANANIEIGFVIGTFGDGPVYGGPGDDILFASHAADTFVIGPDAGDDMIVHFDTSQDVLSFSGETPGQGDWVDVVVNGQAGIRWNYDSGESSLTILGLTTADVGSLMIESEVQALQTSGSFYYSDGPML